MVDCACVTDESVKSAHVQLVFTSHEMQIRWLQVGHACPFLSGNPTTVSRTNTTICREISDQVSLTESGLEFLYHTKPS
jgi:hypothetical protein